MNRYLFAALVGGAVVCMGMIPPVVHEHVTAKPRYQPTEIEAAKESIALSLLGQLQLSVGDMMWMKSMEYLHMGMVQRMPTRAEEARGYRRQDSVNTAAGLGHAEGVQLVLDQERDWRGFFGEIERAVKPYDTMHKHDDPVELIPWYELAVKLNPTLERLYTLGAFYLADFAHEAGEAREMLEAGLKANPLSFEIHGALGRLYVDFAEKLHELEHDEHHGEEHHEEEEEEHEEEEHQVQTPEQAYQEAVELLARSIKLGKQYRDELLAKREVFDDFQNQVLGESYIFLSKAHIGLKQYEKAIVVAEEGWVEASKYAQRNLLKVQKRVAEKSLAGEQADEQEQRQLALAGDTSQLVDQLPKVARLDTTDVGGIVMPLAVAIGVVPPENAALPEPEDIEKRLLPLLREVPYATVATLAQQAGAGLEEASRALELLVSRKFAAKKGEGGDARYHLTTIGLHVAMGRYDFSFWQAMDMEIAKMRADGLAVPEWSKVASQ
jgi:hypothetical protein